MSNDALREAAIWLHAAYDRPPQTPECIAMLAKVDAALAASKPEPQAQAGEPEVMERIAFYLLSGGLFNPELADHEKVRDLLIDCREAIAKKDTALQACVEALKLYLAKGWFINVANDAIQQAQEALK